MRRTLRIILGRRQIARVVDDELAFHLATRVDRLVAAGMSADDARREALRQFGDVAGVRQACITLDEDRERTMRRLHFLIAEPEMAPLQLDSARRIALIRALERRIAALPGVAAVSASENGVFSGTESATTILVPGFVARSGDDSTTNYDRVAPGYFTALGTRMVAGREISQSDDDAGGHTAVVNEAFARFFFGATSPVGRTFRIDSTSYTIVGVATDVMDHTLREAPSRRAYLSLLARNDPPLSPRLEIRTRGDPAARAAAVRAALGAEHAGLAATPVTTLEESMRQSVEQERLVARFATAFGLGALFLAALGLYGVMSYAITQIRSPHSARGERRAPSWNSTRRALHGCVVVIPRRGPAPSRPRERPSR